MKKIRMLLASLLLLIVLASCGRIDKFEFVQGDSLLLFIGEEKKLEIDTNDNIKKDIVYYSADESIASISPDGTITGIKEGTTYASASYKDYKAEISIKVFNKFADYSLAIEADYNKIGLNDEVEITASLIGMDVIDVSDKVSLRVSEGKASINGNSVQALEAGELVIEGEIYGVKSNAIRIKVIAGKEVELRSPKYSLMIGDSIDLSARVIPGADGEATYELVGSDDVAILNGKTLKGLRVGTARVVAKFNDVVSNEIAIDIVEATDIKPLSIMVNTDYLEMTKGMVAKINYSIYPSSARSDIELRVVAGKNNAEIINNTLYCLNDGAFTIQGFIGDIESNKYTINSKNLSTDPYKGMSDEEFYKNYTPATSYADSVYRSMHSFMSGSIEDQNQKPSIAKNQPKENGKLIRNSDSHYSKDMNTYYVVNERGEIVNAVFKNGGYVTLEEVAAHVFAFGEVPANHTEGKMGDPEISPWGIYLRGNHTPFSGDNKRFPYEPALPDISGLGGDIHYYEMDLGTTGTDCDPKYPPRVYNDGRTINRGAARIVYTRYDANHDKIIDINEKHLFYTYNHYNDFQEYLNYEGGWGEMFGNITGGGKLSSRNPNYAKPTPYVEVVFKSFSSMYA